MLPDIETMITPFLEQGILGAILIILFILFKKFIERLFKLVENNTRAITENATILKEFKTVISNCPQNKKGK